MSLWQAPVETYDEDEPERPHRYPCPSRDRRDQMTDDEFWADVYPQQDCPDDEPPVGLASLAVEPCPVCGAQGACSYDVEGRPLIHTDSELPEDEVPA